jgi:SRSO17 transposase
MRVPNAKNDVCCILSWFSGAFSRPSFKFFSSYVVSFIRLGKEAHTASMVKAVSTIVLVKSLSSFTRFLGKNTWEVDEVMDLAIQRFFQTLRIQARSPLFLLLDDTIHEKTGKKIPGCAWYKDHARNLASVFGHQWVLAGLLWKDSLMPFWARLYHSKKTKGCGRFHTKIALAQKMVNILKLPIPCKLYLLADSWYWAKPLVQTCRNHGYHMISQLKSNSVVEIKGKRTRVTDLDSGAGAYRDISIVLYGKEKTLKLAKWIGTIKGIGRVALVVVKEKRKKTRYLVSTNIYLPALEILKYYARRWKIEQMIKDLKQRLGFGEYQVRNLPGIHRHMAITLLSYFVLVMLKLLQSLKSSTVLPEATIRALAALVRRNILVETITITFKTMRVRFKQNILDSYLEQFGA